MAYLEVWIEVEGAIDEQRSFDEDEMISYDEWLDELRDEAEAENFEVEVYEIHHNHDVDFGDDGEGCHCVQELTSHLPAYTFRPRRRARAS